MSMAASKGQSALNYAPNTGAKFGIDDTKPESAGTPEMSSGSTTASGHGDHPVDNADDSNVTLPTVKIGPQKEDLEGEHMRPAGEGDVMNAQFDKSNAGWGEEHSLTSDLDRQKKEQQGARKEVEAERRQGQWVDGGAGARIDNEGLSEA